MSVSSPVASPAAATSVSSSLGATPSIAIGVLTKWVNYGKGWRKRVVVVENGVLTYFTVRF